MDRVLTYKNLIYLLNLQVSLTPQQLLKLAIPKYKIRKKRKSEGSKTNSDLVYPHVSLLKNTHFTPQPLRPVRVLFSPMVSGRAGGRVGSGKKFVRAVSQKS